jgi:uncharacterized caspase-like protein
LLSVAPAFKMTQMARTSVAIVVGIDDYVQQPLTSAVGDARAFAAALVELRLVRESDLTLLTSADDGLVKDDSPTRRRILDALRPFHTGQVVVDRLFFYYAGHGLLAYSDPARALARTALVPVDVRDLETDGTTLIDLESVVARLRSAGPNEQFFFIDACRDLAYGAHPDTTTALGWTAVQPGPERAQAVLYAVAPLGRARGGPDGRGVMTKHLVDALHGQGIALDYSDEDRKYVISPESVAAYVTKRVRETVGAVPLWERKYILPRLDHREPKTSAIRVVDSPADRELTVLVEPPGAAAATKVVLSLMGVDVASWPPNAFRAPFPIRPRRHWLDASSNAGTPDPERVRLDAREEHAATILIWSRDQPGPSGGEPEPGPSPPKVSTVVERWGEGGFGWVTAAASEDQVFIELEQLDPPYAHWTAAGHMEESVPPGDYRIQFRLGADVFSVAEIAVESGAQTAVQPMIGASPLLREMRDRGSVRLSDPPVDAVISDAIGPIQAGIVGTMLPIVGIKPFDLRNELFQGFGASVPLVDPASLGLRPVSLVVAVDGNRWQSRPSEIVRSTRCWIEPHEGLPIDLNLAGLTGPSADPGRIGLAFAQAPLRPFVVAIESLHLGSVRVAAASLPRRATVIAIAVRPDGGFDLSQNLLRLPGLQYDEPVPNVPYDRMLREVQLGQKLYQSNELANRGLLTELFYGKWTDPILSCMAYFSSLDVGERGVQLADDWMLDLVADNLAHFFPDLPDAQVVQALQRRERLDDLLSRLLASGDLPVLARSAQELAARARELGYPDAPVVSASRRALTGQPWLMTWRASSAERASFN